MAKVIVGRPINEISLNGLEYLVDDNNKIMEFENEEAAKAFLTDNGVAAAYFEEITFEEVE